MAKRNDSSGYLYHWIKADPFMRFQDSDWDSAFSVMKEIIDCGEIRAGLTMEKGGHECICLTESPKYTILDDSSKYQPFGFEFSKGEIFSLGGRPAIYSTQNEKSLLDKSIHWRFMPFDLQAVSTRTPYGIDFTWEREWRLNEAELLIEDATRIYVPNKWYACLLVEYTNDKVHKSISDEFDGYANPAVEKYFDDLQCKIEIV
ncbi:hypothetical protein GVN99_15390 [Serratia marcescens]|uniref:hypothetical protein n=1 Tax=Serratia TaxID=613 RepID=UPI001572479F|nr:hypothetical protein [Serratia marcescens]NSM20497.1 hypothetical protein [Serratia marcescens]NSM47756.1 hypothetical protein [Serratia marcescens]